MNDFDAAVSAWLANPGPARHLLVILPPCDDSHVVEEWARARNLLVLHAPLRLEHDHELASTGMTLPAVPVDSVLVIPNLEQWFLRRRKGLVRVRALLQAISRSPAPCVVTCNSWAWKFLVRSVKADLVLTNPMTYRAFDADRLAGWFSAGAENSAAGHVQFRLADSGADVMARDSAGELKSKAMQQLAARSLGIPSTAWQLWRRSLMTSFTGDGADGTAVSESKNRQVFWIRPIEDVQLPAGYEEEALFVLHALLVHGALSEAELIAVLPDPASSSLLTALGNRGFVEARAGRWSVNAGAYPAIRKALQADGYPAGEI